MSISRPSHFLIVGAGAAGLMAARELARAGKRVTLLEARDRIGGRIYPLPEGEFGYRAEGGAEFVHGEAPVTRRLLREAGLALSPGAGTRGNMRNGIFSDGEPRYPHEDRLQQALTELTIDMPIAEFLETRFSGTRYDALRRSIIRMVEGYDAADPTRASTFALREEWMVEGLDHQGRITEGYGALIDFLAAECRRHGTAIHLQTCVTAIDQGNGSIAARCADGTLYEADAAILTVPLPLLADIALPSAARAKAAAAADIGYGNVVKILLRFKTRFWADHCGRDLTDLSFLRSDTKVPTWWTQYPESHPVLTGWYAGPKTDSVAGLGANALTMIGITSLAEMFGLPQDRLTRDLVAARAINWGNDAFARGAYSYATPRTREAQEAMAKQDGSGVLFSGEALYAGADMGTVEAALSSGLETAQAILEAV